jgi:hypothetical protein
MRNKISKLTIGALIACLFLSTIGCFYSKPEISSDIPEQPDYTPYQPSPIDIVEPIPNPVIPTDNNPTIIDDYIPPEDITWISPGKVTIGNFHAGARAEYPISVHNGNNIPAEFLVYYKKPTQVLEGYSIPPNSVQDWILIADCTTVIGAKSTKDILIVLEMPGDAKSPGSNWEFWIAVKDNSQAGTVQTELCSRWLVNMRNS